MADKKGKQTISITLPVVEKVRNESEFRNAKCVAKAYAEAISVIESQLDALWGKLADYQERKTKK